MLMREVSEAFAALEATTKRLEMTRILGDLFGQASADEVDKIIYLLHGRVGPPFEAVEFGVDERLLLRALAAACDRPIGEVEREYRHTGDVGAAGEILLSQQGRDLSVSDVFERLRAIAEATGPGSQERKVSLTRDLLRQLSSLSVRYVIRIIQGKLRLGVGEATEMDALSWSVAGDASLRPSLERAFNLCSDLGLVARVLKAEGPTALERFEPQPGHPIRAELAERLSTPAETIAKLGCVQAEPKYDGVRLQLHKAGVQVWFFTRRLENVTPMFPELARAALRQIRADEVIIDGEAVVYNPETGEFVPFQTTVRRKRKYGIEEMEARYPLRFFAFDLLFADGRDLTTAPLAERRQELEAVIGREPDDPIQVTEYLVTCDPVEAERFFQEMVGRGLEGILAKRPEAPYQAGQRNFTWVKLKRAYRSELRDTVDVVMVGYLLGKGKRARFGIGSLLGAVYDPEQGRFRTVSKIGSGLTDEEWVELRRLLDESRTERKPSAVESIIEPDVWVEPRYVIEVQADEITRSPMHTAGKVDGQPGYALRFPRMVRFRFDKAPEDATTELEIIQMYERARAPSRE